VSITSGVSDDGLRTQDAELMLGEQGISNIQQGISNIQVEKCISDGY
jgi:hypothetical protein